jgi:hypothetical protein
MIIHPTKFKSLNASVKIVQNVYCFSFNLNNYYNLDTNK